MVWESGITNGCEGCCSFEYEIEGNLVKIKDTTKSNEDCHVYVAQVIKDVITHICNTEKLSNANDYHWIVETEISGSFKYTVDPEKWQSI